MKNPLLSLVGAGPGDAELITIKAIRAIRKADVVLYDTLANPALLKYAKTDCIIKFVGKTTGCHSFSQKIINTLIAEFALSHERIVRLKGGDPFVFGRSQEEIDAAMAAGMDVEIIPGISSALAVPASHMIPLTCRGVSESFWVVSGTTQSGTISKDIHLAARSSATVIILMAMRNLETIMSLFSAQGKTDTPVAIIQNGTTKNKKIVVGTVRDIFKKAQAEKISNPAIIIVGEVVNINDVTSLKRQFPIAENPLSYQQQAFK